ncbi:MAG: peptide-methionine (S)-S-oxide reductase MsrA [Gammaproteobacteria bacterium]|nr:peptide-methionine (S)-S-oxide reductase MsrA [Gammaproteobacteria bacterium]
MQARLKFSTLLTSFGAVTVLALGIALSGLPAHSAGAMYGANIPSPQARLRQPADGKSAQAVLAGGCFWGMELVFAHVKGVLNVVSGYAGGEQAHANYADSSSGRYGDAEAVRITYDPSKVSYGQLLHIFFSVAHDPTELNRQGPDVGPQYRSEIFAANADQARVARAYIRQLDAAQVYGKPIATRVSVGESFFPAEAWHQNYAVRNPGSLYIRWNDIPKLHALEQRFPQRYTAQYADGM